MSTPTLQPDVRTDVTTTNGPARSPSPKRGPRPNRLPFWLIAPALTVMVLVHVLPAIGGLVIAIVVGLVLFGRPIVELVYVRGAFSPDDANRVIALLPVYAAYIGVTAMNQLLARYFFVHHEGRRYTTFMLGAYVAANVLKPFLVVPFGLNGVVGASLICEGIVLVYFVVAVLVRERRATLD